MITTKEELPNVVVEEDTLVIHEADHLLFKDLLSVKGDQVATILRAGMRGWVQDSGIWPLHCEGRFDRNAKKKNATFSIFSNLSKEFGLPEVEEPFIQLEVDRDTKKRTPMKKLEFGFGIAESVLKYPILRDMVYPYFYLATVLLRGRGCTPVAIYPETEDRPLQFDLRSGPDVYRVMIWQNRLINEYNRIIKVDPSFHVVPDGKLESYKNPAERRAEEQEEEENATEAADA